MTNKKEPKPIQSAEWKERFDKQFPSLAELYEQKGFIGTREMIKVFIHQLLADQQNQEIKKGESYRLGYQQGIAEVKSSLLEKIEGAKKTDKNGKGLPYENSPEIYGNQRIEAYRNGFNSGLERVKEIIAES